MLGVLQLLIKISGINLHSGTSCQLARFKLEVVEVMINGSDLSSSKFQMTVKIGHVPRANQRSILQTQIGTL